MNKKLTQNLASGHGTCAGCGIPVIVRNVLGATKDPVVVINATGCLEVTTTLYPYSPWKVPYIHNAFENAGATASGVETAYRALAKRGKIEKKIKFVVFAGDGGTYDIGLQSLSGALERGHEFVYVCYDNQAYSNTGGQRSGATPFGASTQTTPSGQCDIGNELFRKDIMGIVKAHHIKYIAQANAAFPEDLKRKAEKAFATKGPSFLLVFQPCNNEMKFPTSQYVAVGKLATETNFWPLYEISAKGGSASGGENWEYKINYVPQERKPIEEFLKTQGRFKHLFAERNKGVIAEMQKQVDQGWVRLERTCSMKHET
ncbi:MAG: pyruvate ferredoxin oxidoreductase [Candidatus Moranbacteria bacterium CG_4_9_14_3_um_filter_42_9]|nr:MAG: pyruvate ferredoxin oxidoreductase [Candidatus Moranbacteria bacterium CG_4_9_14_3_um_filter_42_9]